MSWLYRGAQSALFYYASCAPLHRRKHIRRRAQQNKRDRAAREEYEATLPPHLVYQQPEPLKTNEHWDEEIAAGPAPSTNKRAVKTQDNAFKRLRRGHELARNTPIEVPEILVDEADDHHGDPAVHGVEVDGLQSSTNVSNTASLGSRSPSRATSRNNHRKWQNHKRWYQRPDEELDDIQRIDTDSELLSGSLGTSSIRRPASVPKGEVEPYPTPDSASSFISPPPASAIRDTYETTIHVGNVNNNQTPLATPARFLKSASSQWMFQDLPAPSFMSGKDPEPRSRTNTLSSRGSAIVVGRNSTGSLKKDQRNEDLRRQLSVRTLEEKLRRTSGTGHGGNSSNVMPRLQQEDAASATSAIWCQKPKNMQDADADGEEADDEDEDAFDTDDEEEIDSRPSTRQQPQTSSGSSDIPISPSTPPIKPSPAAFDPSKPREALESFQRSPKKSNENYKSITARRRSNHRKRMTPDTASFLFSYPVPLPEAFKEDPDVARKARLSWERRLRGEAGDGEMAWQRLNWTRGFDEADAQGNHHFYDGPNDSVLVEDTNKAEQVDERRRSAATF